MKKIQELSSEEIEEALIRMKAHRNNYVSMDGKYPCWIVYLPGYGRTTRKSLVEAIEEFCNHKSKAKD